MKYAFYRQRLLGFDEKCCRLLSLIFVVEKHGLFGPIREAINFRAFKPISTQLVMYFGLSCPPRVVRDFRAIQPVLYSDEFGPNFLKMWRLLGKGPTHIVLKNPLGLLFWSFPKIIIIFIFLFFFGLLRPCSMISPIRLCEILTRG